MSEGVLEFLENVRTLPSKLTVERTKKSSYLFWLVVTHYRRRLRRTPQFFVYSKIDADRVKGLIEEHSLFGEPGLYVLEGYGQRFFDALSLPQGTYVVGEATEGELKAEPFSHRQRRNLLKVLCQELNLKFSLRELLKLDWTSCRDYPEFEVVLRRAKILQWTVEDLSMELTALQTGSILEMLKWRHRDQILGFKQRYGARWIYHHLMELLTQLAHYRALLQLGYEPDRAQRDMGLGWNRAKELDAAVKFFTVDDIQVMTDRILSMDALIQRKPDLGVECLLLNAPVGVRR